MCAVKERRAKKRDASLDRNDRGGPPPNPSGMGLFQAVTGAVLRGRGCEGRPGIAVERRAPGRTFRVGVLIRPRRTPATP